MDKEDARALLASTQQLRTHWSGVITSHFILAVTINVALWSYFGMAFIDSMKATAEPRLLYLASALSSFLVGLWRIYTRYIDDNIAKLYPDFLLYEGILKVPFDRGTSGYLIKNVPRLSDLLKRQLSLEEKLYAIDYLVNTMKRAGHRGHKTIDFIVLGYVVVLTLLSVAPIHLYSLNNYYYGFLIGNVLGLWLIYLSLTKYQRNPCDRQIKELLQSIKRRRET